MTAVLSGHEKRVVVVGEVLWDIFPDSRCLGGAPLNFGAHARRLGYEVDLVSAVGPDDLGREATLAIGTLNLDTTFLQTSDTFPTGTAAVRFVDQNESAFTIQRPAAYDAIRVSDRDIELLRNRQPDWIYHGTLFPSTREGRKILDRLLDGLHGTPTFYDVNLRPSADSPDLVNDLLERASVVKLNEQEFQRVHEFTGLPGSIEGFCREGIARYGWSAVCVTLGEDGCAALAGGHYVECASFPVVVADTVGAGDAFAAAFMHALSSNWPVHEVAAFANRVGALVASRAGAIPDWTLEEAATL